MKSKAQKLEALAREMLDFIGDLAIGRYARIGARLRLTHFERKLDRITWRKKSP